MGRRTLALVLCICIGMFTTGCGKYAGSFYKKGMQAYRQMDYDTAEDCFKKAIEKNADKAEYYISYGFALAANKHYKQATKQFEHAIIDKDNQIVKENNKAAYRGLGIVYYKQQLYEEASDMFEQALKITEASGLNLDLFGYLAGCMEMLGDYKQAISYYNKILAIEKSAAVYAKKALAEEQKGDVDQALDDYNQAISLDKKDYNLYIQKYSLLKRFEKKEEAKETLKQAASIQPETNGQKYGQAKVFYFLGEEGAAKKAFLEALENGFAEAGFYLGEIEKKEGAYEEAASYYTGYIESGSRISGGAVYNELGLVYLALGKYAYARDTFTIGIEQNDPLLQKELKRNRITAYEYLGNFEKALKDADEFLLLYPEDKKMKKERKFIRTRLYNH